MFLSHSSKRGTCPSPALLVRTKSAIAAISRMIARLNSPKALSPGLRAQGCGRSRTFHRRPLSGLNRPTVELAGALDDAAVLSSEISLEASAVPSPYMLRPRGANARLSGSIIRVVFCQCPVHTLLCCSFHSLLIEGRGARGPPHWLLGSPPWCSCS